MPPPPDQTLPKVAFYSTYLALQICSSVLVASESFGSPTGSNILRKLNHKGRNPPGVNLPPAVARQGVMYIQVKRQQRQFHGARTSNLCALATIKSGVTASHEKEKAEDRTRTEERSLSSLFLPTKLRTIPALGPKTQWVPSGVKATRVLRWRLWSGETHAATVAPLSPLSTLSSGGFRS